MHKASRSCPREERPREERHTYFPLSNMRGQHRKVVVLPPDLLAICVLAGEHGEVEWLPHPNGRLMCVEVALRWMIQAVMKEVTQLRSMQWPSKMVL